MLPFSLEKCSAFLVFFAIVTGITDEYSKIASAQLVGPFTGKDNVFSLLSESAFDSAFDLYAAICPANERARLHQLHIRLYWLQDNPGTLHFGQDATPPGDFFRNLSHPYLISSFSFIL
jgi:hypothetical protein